MKLSNLLSLRCIGGIGESAFHQNPSLETLTNIHRRSETITNFLPPIDDSAFAKCGYLSGVGLSELLSLRCIGEYAFADCESVQLISLSILPLLESINNGAFVECVHLSRVEISNLPSLRTIGERVFAGCKSLQLISLYLPLLGSIGDRAFAECMHLSSVDLSDLPSLRTIDEGAFWKCESLQSISLANVPLLARIAGKTLAECVQAQPQVQLQSPSQQQLAASGPHRQIGEMQSKRGREDEDDPVE